MSLASVAAQQSSALAAANAAAAGFTPAGTGSASTGSSSAGSAGAGSASTGSASTATTGSALGSLSGNFDQFLKLLMTQLQNQDPTNPLDTNQFTSQLVQFSSVEQQINTNTSLTQLIQLTQSGELMQSSSMIGKQVAVASDHVPLQNGTGTITFTAPASEPAAIAIYSDTGTKIRNASLDATKGANTWTWDGRDNAGNTVADGSYRVAVVGANADGSTAALPFTVLGTATGVQKQGNAIQIQLGGLSTDFTSVQSLGSQ